MAITPISGMMGIQWEHIWRSRRQFGPCWTNAQVLLAVRPIWGLSENLEPRDPMVYHLFSQRIMVMGCGCIFQCETNLHLNIPADRLKRSCSHPMDSTVEAGYIPAIYVSGWRTQGQYHCAVYFLVKPLNHFTSRLFPLNKELPFLLVSTPNVDNPRLSGTCFVGWLSYIYIYILHVWLYKMFEII